MKEVVDLVLLDAKESSNADITREAFNIRVKGIRHVGGEEPPVVINLPESARVATIDQQLTAVDILASLKPSAGSTSSGAGTSRSVSSNYAASHVRAAPDGDTGDTGDTTTAPKMRRPSTEDNLHRAFRQPAATQGSTGRSGGSAAKKQQQYEVQTGHVKVVKAVPKKKAVSSANTPPAEDNNDAPPTKKVQQAKLPSWNVMIMDPRFDADFVEYEDGTIEFTIHRPSNATRMKDMCAMKVGLVKRNLPIDPENHTAFRNMTIILDAVRDLSRGARIAFYKYGSAVGSQKITIVPVGDVVSYANRLAEYCPDKWVFVKMITDADESSQCWQEGGMLAMGIVNTRSELYRSALYRSLMHDQPFEFLPINCAICQEDVMLENGDYLVDDPEGSVIHLPCYESHVFHRDCLAQHFAKAISESLPKQCPLCREVVPEKMVKSVTGLGAAGDGGDAPPGAPLV